MTADFRFDARLRAALVVEPRPDELETSRALGEVLARSGRSARRRMGAVASWVAVATAVAAIVVVPTILDDDAGPTLPITTIGDRSVVGTWQRSVAAESEWSGGWRMDLRDDGVVRLAGPRDLPASTEGVSYAVAGDEVRIDAFVNDACAEQPAGVYRVVVSDTMLRLTALDESCSLRAAVFDGTWGRAGT